MRGLGDVDYPDHAGPVKQLNKNSLTRIFIVARVLFHRELLLACSLRCVLEFSAISYTCGNDWSRFAYILEGDDTELNEVSGRHKFEIR